MPLEKDDRSPESGAGAGMRDVNRIPKDALDLEPRHFAQGGSGLVFKGRYHDGHYAGTVAAKQLIVQDAKNREAILHEINMLTKVSHPFIMALYGIYEDPERGILMVRFYLPY